MVAKAFISNPENKPQINHIKPDKSCNFVDNLEWCTPRENGKHAYKHGLLKSKINELVDSQGETNGNAKLTEKEVLEIRHRYKNNNITQTKLANEYGVTQVAISEIILRNRWTHI